MSESKPVQRAKIKLMPNALSNIPRSTLIHLNRQIKSRLDFSASLLSKMTICRTLMSTTRTKKKAQATLRMK